MKELRGRVAVVTGAASGIGRATALALAREGCAVALVDLDAERLAGAAKEVQRHGVRATCHIADVADAARMDALAAEIEEEHGAVHVLVNNAGVSVLKSFEDHTLEDFQWLVGVNFWGVVHGCRSFLPALRRAEEAHIVNISSMFGFVGVPGQSSYCATKFAVRGFTESLWAELRGTQIGVSSVHPGGISTGIARTVRVMHEGARAELQKSFDDYGHPPEEVADVVVRVIQRNQLRGIAGIEAYFVDWLKRLMPIGFHRWFASRMRVPGSESSEQGTEGRSR